MSTPPHSTGLSDEWKRRLDDIKEKAKRAEKGSTYFMEVSSIPVMSLFVVTGEKSKTAPNENETHLHFSGQPDTYPILQDAEVAIESIGYQHYLSINSGCEVMDLTTYKSKFASVCDDINRATKECHGVKCYEDGSTQNTHITNVLYLHICDILNIIVNKKKEKQTDVVIKTRLLSVIAEEMTNEFEDIYLTKDNRLFLFDNIDYIYYYHAYLFNRSILPVRSDISLQSDVFIHSLFFMNNEHYVRHQDGKLHEIIQNDCDMFTKVKYRTI